MIRMNLRPWIKAALFVAVLMTLAASKKNGYTVKGTVQGAKDGDTVLLVEMQGFGMLPLDTAVIAKGKFVFTGIQDEPVWRFVVCKNGEQYKGGTDFILENGNITIAVVAKGRTAAKGTANNELWNHFMAESERQDRVTSPLWKLANDSTATEAERETADKTLQRLRKENDQYKFDFIRKHIRTGVSHILLESAYMGYSVEQLELITQDFAKAKINSDLAQAIGKYVAGMKKTAIGVVVENINLPNEKGEIIGLLNQVSKNKITLVDFWASWCGPCRAEVPHLKEAYKDYRAKGFEIVGISLDQSGEAWKKAMVDLEMPWPQMSDLKGWKSVAAQQYGIRAIPFTLLVDQQGKIVAKNLRGKELEEKLAELL